MGLAHSPNIPIEGLVFCVDSENIKSYPGSGTSVFDITGNFSTGSLTNGANVTANGFSFDGSNDFLNMNNKTLDVSNGYTAIMVARFVNFNGGSFRYNQPPLYINFYSGNNSRLRWETYAGNAMRTSAALPTNQNVFVAGTYAGTTTQGGSAIARTYVNGELDNTATLQSGPVLTAPFVLGEYGGYMNGAIRYFSFYTRELSAQEIKEVYNSINERFGI
jgi:hypothetical protein